jgi:hypothetical protein
MPSYNASTPTERPDHVEAGDHEVEVIDANETVSKTGHEMIELKLRTSAGSILYDFLVFIPNAFWKIDAFRAATGDLVITDDGVEVIADDLIGRTGTARLIVEEYGGRRRNKVASWITSKPGGKSAAKPEAQTKSAHHANKPI